MTMLLLCDAKGIVMMPIPGLARRATVTLEECEEALEALASPDTHSRTKTNEGRRIEMIDGDEVGWEVLNYLKYRDKDHTAAERQKRYRQRKSKNVTRNVTESNGESQRVTQAEAEAEYKAPPYTQQKQRERERVHTHAEFSEMGIPAQLEDAKRRLATVRAGWQVEFDAVEREALITQAHLKTISELDDETWATMAEMLSASKKIADRREKLKIGLPKRSTFVCNIGDWIANAEHYRSHHPLPKPKAPAPESPKVIEMTDEEREHARRELKAALR